MHELVRAELVRIVDLRAVDVLSRIANPEVRSARAFTSRADAIVPVVTVGKTSAGPTQHARFDLPHLFDQMRKIKPGVLRWPGGCFADSYNWHDGVGPRSERPRRTNFWIRDSTQNVDSPQVYDPNQFGTNEIMHFCKLIGAQPYFAANLRSLPPKDFYEWVEYCNAPADLSSLSRLRTAAGDREPFAVKYWGVGNESWGCGGNLTAEEIGRASCRERVCNDV